MSPLRGRLIVLGVTGGIAAYKAAEVCRRLVGAGAHVVPVLTAGALRMVGETTFSALASEPAVTSLWKDPSSAIPHTSLGKRADAVVVCPATARLISDLRTGRSGDILTATLLATRAPVIVAPAMHTEMWEQASVQENMAVLAERDVTIVGPVEGPLAGGDIGSGRMAEPAEIVAAVEAVLTPQDLAGRRVLVTSGGTREPIDAVRYVGNRSSGKQGAAVATEAAARGADVVLVTTEPDRTPAAARVVAVETAAEMAAAVELEARGADAVVMAAAVADFRPANPAGTKIKKGQGVPPLELEPTRDILASLGASKPPGQVLVGFAAETEDLEANALDKLRSKNLDVIVANDVSKEQVGFGHDTNEIVMFTADGARHHVPLTTKREAARSVLDKVVALMAEAQ
ncbi:MAG: bifunctional phosphopantothenoylcysteine decarboxylase/phosphopantothenate--cysteine ligase CoaBC [Acidimicrobiaceae bacterium]|nr:bifunctional phosphopantothenoylcysteine decarboxylase/phosphopantothenate--cysteine ligase CoaBC [Acidimicrobiaceae bacterium]MDE0516433.1 bifunctional phosphopantothenoylcysteine decarboxylase/phosphopantothenate--cysteine ligase CoaBC [Acidimicrobiaceae bacterium]MDE0657599.1 bifunctional phosphopantothenoylcysteine decarboxylase/phosphopantothenate--cysteine ligase CoaBC [Acidimicrobiaceae bacterium]